jgi:hypothetical protein
MSALRLWDAATWKLSAYLRSDGISEANPFAFSPDGRLLAVVQSANAIQIVKIPGIETIATLHVPTLGAITSIRFGPDGTTFGAVEWLGQLDLWDLRIIREELRKRNLDWDLPDFPASASGSALVQVLDQLDGGPFSKRELKDAIPARDSNTSSNLIDLTAYYDGPLTQFGDGSGKVQDDLSELPAGVHRMNGIDFDVRGLIQIGALADNGLAYPSHVYGIPVGRQCHQLHFLQAAILAASAHAGDELGSYIIHYTDGRQVAVPIITGKEMADGWSQSGESSAGLVPAWVESNPAAHRNGRTIRLFQTTWENPFPEMPISQLDFESDRPTPGQPCLVAITLNP